MEGLIGLSVCSGAKLYRLSAGGLYEAIQEIIGIP